MSQSDYNFVAQFRQAAPYINDFRGKTFVLMFQSEMVHQDRFRHLAQDIAMLNSLGIHIVLVPATRNHIDSLLKQRHIATEYIEGVRLTSDEILPVVKETNGVVRAEIEAALSMNFSNTPTSHGKVTAYSGNFVIAKPVGIHNGIDFQHTGHVRRVDTLAIQHIHDKGGIAIVSPLGYSSTGEVFNLTAFEVATTIASALKAEKLIFLVPEHLDTALPRQFSPASAKSLLDKQPQTLTKTIAEHLHWARKACTQGVTRTHLVPDNIDGGILLELFTRDGVAAMVSATPYEQLRAATLDDIVGILELITPLEQAGTLIPRGREYLERDLDDYLVMERDGAIIGCAALHRYPDHSMAELASIAVHTDYRKNRRGHHLLEQVEQQAKQFGIKTLFVLTTQTTHWFQEHGFEPRTIEDLPMQKQKLYNYQRKSKVLMKTLN